MNRAFIIGAGLLALAAAPASAADISPRMPVKAPVMAPMAPSWTGFYIGINGGYAFGNTRASETGLPLGNIFASGDYNLDHNLTGWLAGGQIGYNWQMGMWVFGLEADFDGADIKGNGTVSGLTVAQRNGGAAFATNFVTAGEKIDYFGTFRGRFGGLVAPDLLLYVTGGLAYASVNYNGQFHYATPVDYLVSGKSTRVGWTVGGGAEFRVAPNWTVKAEYLYYDLGSQSLTSDNGIPAIPPFQSQFDYKTNGSLVRGGINYKFDWGGPVVARY